MLSSLITGVLKYVGDKSSPASGWVGVSACAVPHAFCARLRFGIPAFRSGRPCAASPAAVTRVSAATVGGRMGAAMTDVSPVCFSAVLCVISFHQNCRGLSGIPKLTHPLFLSAVIQCPAQPVTFHTFLFSRKKHTYTVLYYKFLPNTTLLNRGLKLFWGDDRPFTR